MVDLLVCVCVCVCICVYVCMCVLLYTDDIAMLGSARNSNHIANAEIHRRDPQNGMTRNASHIWPNGIIPYVFDDSISK